MSSIEYDPITGLPRQQSLDPNSPLRVAFGAGTAGSTGSTGYGTGATPGVPNADAYRNIIQNDPIYKQILADLSAQGISDEAGAQAAARRGIIQFGEVPSSLDSAAAAWIDEPTRQLAAQNTAAGFSLTARLGKQQTDALRRMRNALAARGGLRSGEFGHQLGEQQKEYETAQYDAREQLSQYFLGIQRGLAEAKRQRAAAQAQALQGAAGRAPGIYGNPPPPSAPPPAAPPPAAPPPPPPIVDPFREPERLVHRPPHFSY